ALGRMFNGLALAAEARARGDQTEIVFTGAGTRWPEELTKPAHPAHELYEKVRPSVAGACKHCAAVFGATAGVETCGLPSIQDHNLPGTQGLASLRRYLTEGWNTLTF